jgi:hypothetical protein
MARKQKRGCTHQEYRHPSCAGCRARFLRFLEETLIPDLKASGTEFTAEDFETAVAMMKHLEPTNAAIKDVQLEVDRVADENIRLAGAVDRVSKENAALKKALRAMATEFSRPGPTRHQQDAMDAARAAIGEKKAVRHG